MTHDKSNHPEFDDLVNSMKNDQPSAEEVRAAGQNVWQKLRSTHLNEVAQPEMIHGCEDVVKLVPAYAGRQLTPERAILVESHLRDCVNCRRRAEGREPEVLQWKPAVRPASRSWQVPRFALAAAVIVFAVVTFFVYNTWFAIPAGARATLQSLNGAAYVVSDNGTRALKVGDAIQDGEVVRTAAGSHAYVRLTDGSIVEVRERSELAVKARGKNETIDLDRGAVIVQAAKRHSGHLYVKTPDARVAVTGTVFSVNAAVKGSRVMVVEGTVEVEHGGSDDVLHAGGQVATGANMETVSYAQEIGWSQDFDKHLELLAQFKKLENRLEQVQLPGPRYHSALLDRMPADVVFYASLPNAGPALEQANQLLQDQISQSGVLKEWFTHGDPNASTKFNDAISKIRQLSDYLGDEVVVVGFTGHGGAIVAEIRQPGLAEFLQTKFTIEKGDHIAVLNQAQLASGAQVSGPVALVRESEVIFSGNANALERVNAALNTGGGLASTDFGHQLIDAYNRGAGFLLAADLNRLIADQRARSAAAGRPVTQSFDRTGFGDMHYLVVEHREVNQQPINRVVLDFKSQRRGIPSWLAPAGPMGSLEFVSRNAGLAIAVLVKDPPAIFDDVLGMAPNQQKAQSELAEAQSKLNLRIREDLAAQFGGDAVLALDGSVVPTPAWRFVIDIHDADALQASIAKLVQFINNEAQQHGKPGVTLQVEDASGQKYYTILSAKSGAKPMYYTFAFGYMIMGSDRATLMNTIRTRVTGDSLARSGDFKALLPKDENTNYSMIAYQNLSPILQPLLSLVNADQAPVIEEIAADSRPSVACAWGRDNQIEAISNSRLIGLDWLAVGTLFHGTKPQRNP